MTLYHEQPGPENTAATIEAALARARELHIGQMVVASTHGKTAHLVLDAMGDFPCRVVVVAISSSFGPEGWVMDEKTRDVLCSRGATVLQGIHALGDDVNAALSGAEGNTCPNVIVRKTLYRFCQGMKVCIEIVLMAAEAGMLKMDTEVLAVAGSGEGADTAVVVKPAYARRFGDLQVRELIAKPRSW